MKDREKQIEEMAILMFDCSGCINQPCSQCVLHENDVCSNYRKAKRLYDNNYRKMNEVTLRIDLGDCTPEQINEIMEKFGNENPTLISAGMSEKELLELLEMLSKDGDGKDYHASSVQFVAQNTIDYINRLKDKNYDMYSQNQNLQTYIDNHEEVWKRNAEIDKAIVRKDTAKDILQRLFNFAQSGTKGNSNDFVHACNEMKYKIRVEAKKYGVEVNE